MESQSRRAPPEHFLQGALEQTQEVADQPAAGIMKPADQFAFPCPTMSMAVSRQYSANKKAEGHVLSKGKRCTNLQRRPSLSWASRDSGRERGLFRVRDIAVSGNRSLKPHERNPGKGLSLLSADYCQRELPFTSSGAERSCFGNGISDWAIRL